MGDLQTQTEEDLIKLFSQINLNYEEVAICVNNQNKLIDGLSGQRIKKSIAALWN